MTQEEKAKRYDEAVKKFKPIYDLAKKQGRTIDVEEFENIFPELKESREDEMLRVIKEVILNSVPYKINILTKDTTITAEEAIAWLEKQEGCEHIKKDWLEHIKQSWYKEGFIDGKYSGGASKEWTTNDAATLKELIDFLENGTAKLQHDLTRYANWLKIQFTPIEKQGEQKPIDKIEPKFKIGDIVRFKGNETIEGEEEIHKIVGYDNELYVFADGTTDLFCEQDLYELVEQNSAWSEEDEKIYQSIMDDTIQENQLDKKQTDWLRDIKYRYFPQSKQEWSEEDEKHRLNCLSYFNMIEKTSPYYEDYLWLKYLKDRYTWKPSDEQLKYVQEQGERNDYTGYVMTNLYNDLKKLREE